MKGNAVVNLCMNAGLLKAMIGAGKAPHDLLKKIGSLRAGKRKIMSDTFDPVRSFCDAASEAVKTIAQETIREQLTRAEFSSVFVVAKEEMAAIIAGHITLPVIYTFLNLVNTRRASNWKQYYANHFKLVYNLLGRRSA